MLRNARELRRTTAGPGTRRRRRDTLPSMMPLDAAQRRHATRKPRLDLLDLEHARRPRLAARQPGGDADALAALAPTELHDAADGVGDERLGDLVARHGSGLHPPHEPATAHRLAPGREGVDGDVGPVRGHEP